MREDGKRTRVYLSLALGLGVAWIAQTALAQGACEQIRAACQEAGFVQGGAKGGNGLQVDCIDPIMQGSAQPHNASKPSPQIDATLVAACKARKSSFGQPRPPRSESGAQPSPISPLPPIAAAESAPSHALSTPGGRPNIVFVLTDDLSWNLVQYMPHVLKMQQDGVTFANYFVTDSLCCPSR